MLSFSRTTGMAGRVCISVCLCVCAQGGCEKKLRFAPPFKLLSLTLPFSVCEGKKRVVIEDGTSSVDVNLSTLVASDLSCFVVFHSFFS